MSLQTMARAAATMTVASWPRGVETKSPEGEGGNDGVNFVLTVITIVAVLAITFLAGRHYGRIRFETILELAKRVVNKARCIWRMACADELDEGDIVATLDAVSADRRAG